MRVIAVANQKGGCGKTTTSINFTASLAFLQKNTLLVDWDPQGHSTCGLGINQKDFPHNLYEVLSPFQEKKPSIPELLCQVEPNLWLIPAYGILGALEEELANLYGKERRLREILDRIRNEQQDLEYAVIDCPPNLGILTLNALDAADEVFIPIEPSFFSLHGLAKMTETLQEINRRRSEAIETHALLTIFDSRTCFAKEVYQEVKDHFKEALFKTIIHESVLLKEAASAGKSITKYDPESGAFRDYLNLAVEYLEKEWDRLLPSQRLGWSNVINHLYGPRRVSGGVLFQAMSKNARGVEIAGDFNNWIPEPLLRRGFEGLWQKVIPITKGVFRYKFIVDGEWQLDPYQPLQQVNAFGTFDSYLELV